ncbi:MAG: nitroreductase family protein [Spirochaetes bacterium]|nr:nitroreductase family protein [Spirochaetota bacterium]
MERDFNFNVLDVIRNRWSSRSFKKKQFTLNDILPLIEAARYAPSAYNEQPWFFLISVTRQENEKVIDVLSESNKLWAENASAFIIILARKNFSHNNSFNRWHFFDAGTSFGFLALEAENRGIAVHPMAGFNHDLLIKNFKISGDYDPVTVIAVGYRDIPDVLPEKIRINEKPGLRNALSSIYKKIEDI